MKYAEKLKNLWKCASGDETRYFMNCISIDADKKVAVATDGHILAAIDITDLLETGEKSFLLPGEALKAAQQLLTSERGRWRSKNDKINKTRPVFIQATEDAVTVFVGTSRRGQSFDKPKKDFPKWEGIIPKQEGYGLGVELDPELLLKLADGIRSGAFHKSGVSLFVKDEASPIVVSMGNDTKTYGMTMLMRLGYSFPKPFWIPK